VEIVRFPDALVPRARAEYAAKHANDNIWDSEYVTNHANLDNNNDEDIYTDDDDLFLAIEQALAHAEIDMVFVEARDSGLGIVLGRPDNKKRTKRHARVVCAEDEQMLRVQSRYQQYVLDRQTIHARIVAN
jgi:hypothetical protein